MKFYSIDPIAIESAVALAELSTDPVLPPSDILRIYAKDLSGVSTLYYKDDAGNVHQLASTSGLGVTAHTALSSLSWTASGHTGSANTVAAFGASSEAILLTETGTGAVVVLQDTPTILTPTIASFANAGHTHQDAAGGGQLDHGLVLTGLADDDHAQYVLRTGRSGSANNIVVNITTGFPDGKISGTNIASNYLILESTTHATKGKILFGTSAYDDANNRLALKDNDTSAGATIHIHGITASHTALLVGNNDARDEFLKNSFRGLKSSTADEYSNNTFRCRITGGTGDTHAVFQDLVVSGTSAVGSVTGEKAQLQNTKTGGSVSNLIGHSVGMPHNSASGHHVSQINFFVADSSNLYTGTNTFGTVIGYRCTNLFNSVTGTGFAFMSEGGINEFDAGSAGNIVMKVRGFTGQTADLQRWESSVPSTLMKVGPTGLLGVGDPTEPGAGTAGIVFADGTALSSMAANTAGLYADDVGGTVTMHAISENGNVIRLGQVATYTPTNVTTDRSFDANSTTIDELADVLGSLIVDLQTLGFLG